jgi:hypothetical protein
MGDFFNQKGNTYCYNSYATRDKQQYVEMWDYKRDIKAIGGNHCFLAFLI